MTWPPTWPGLQKTCCGSRAWQTALPGVAHMQRGPRPQMLVRCGASDRIGHRPAAGISGTSACRDCKSEEDAVEPPADAGLAGALARMVQRLLALLPHTAGVTEQLVSAVLAACGRQMPCCAAESCWSTGGCEADTHVHNGRHSKSTCGAGQSWPEPMALWLWRSPAAQMPGGCSVQP